MVIIRSARREPTRLPLISVSRNRNMSAHTVKRIVCLANSRMSGGRCIAGKEVHPDGRVGAWVRPVSGWSTGGLSAHERQYEDGTEPHVLDVVHLGVLEPQPKDYQRENWLLDPSRRWVKVGRRRGRALTQWLDAAPTLWVNGDSSDNGVNDRVCRSDTVSLASSLALIRVEDLRVNVSENEGKPAPLLRGSFHYNESDYSLRITDAAIESGSVGMLPGDYEVGERFLTISLTAEPFEGYCYKLIAAIIRPEAR